MKNQIRRCKHCHGLFNPCPKVPKHEYCSDPDCQKARKRDWQKRKMAADESYRKDQQDAQELWRKNNPDYWKKYRARKRTDPVCQ